MAVHIRPPETRWKLTVGVVLSHSFDRMRFAEGSSPCGGGNRGGRSQGHPGDIGDEEDDLAVLEAALKMNEVPRGPARLMQCD